MPTHTQDAEREAVVTRNTPLNYLPEYLTPGEFGAFLGFSRSKTYAALQSGEFPVLRVGRLLRVPRSALER